jgi:hypothetical protein
MAFISGFPLPIACSLITLVKKTASPKNKSVCPSHKKSCAVKGLTINNQNGRTVKETNQKFIVCEDKNTKMNQE